MNDKPLVSIIVPAYNVAGCIEICIKSLLEQTYLNIEIIVVNDTSTDDTAEKLELFKDTRVKIVNHPENLGVTATRKTGWLHSKGDYCMFVDGDDFLAPDAVEYFVSIFQKEDFDFISGWYDIVYEDGTVVEKPVPFTGKFDTFTYISKAMSITRDFQSIWIGIYKRDLFDEKIFAIDRSINRGEDALTLMGFLNKANKICCTDKIFYHYFQRLDSVTHITSVSTEYTFNCYALRYRTMDAKYRDLLLPVIVPVMCSCFFLLCLDQGGYNKPKADKVYELYSPQISNRLSWKTKVQLLCMKNKYATGLYIFLLKCRNKLKK